MLRPGYTNGKLESTAAASIIGDVPMNRRSRDVFAMLNSELVDKVRLAINDDLVVIFCLCREWLQQVNFYQVAVNKLPLVVLLNYCN